MKLPNWFKIIWWFILLGLTGTILFKRYNAFITGQSVIADVFIFLLFVALMLVPIFSEIEFFGIKLKKEIEELKTEIKIRLGDIKNEIRNSQIQTFNATFQGFGPPPPDNKLPALETEIDKIVSEKLKEHKIILNKNLNELVSVPDNNLKLFKVRYSIEKELRRIWERNFFGEDGNRFIGDKTNYRRHQSITSIIDELTKFELLDKNFYSILRDILSICNYATHGENVTDKQVAFVTNNANQILEYLKDIS